MTTPRSAGSWWLALLTLVVVFALLPGCGETPAEECASCPNPDLKPACEQAAGECDTSDDELRQMCIDEALALCE